MDDDQYKIIVSDSWDLVPKPGYELDFVCTTSAVKNEFARKFTNLWLHLFMSSAQYNRSLRLLLNSQDFPTERDLRQYEAGLTEAAAKQFDSSILLANMFQNEEIYPG